MAILRGGKRIGGMDIRIGIPRDRSMDNINRDPRFKLKAGANPATTIGRFQAYAVSYTHLTLPTIAKV